MELNFQLQNWEGTRIYQYYNHGKVLKTTPI